MRRLLIYGDSNSFGVGPMPHLGADVVHAPGVRWGDVLATELTGDWDVIVEGLPGRTSTLDDPVEGNHLNGLTILPAILNSHRPIDLLVICLGTNDQKARFGLAAFDVALSFARLLRAGLASGVVADALAICPPPLKERGDFADMFKGAETRGTGLPGHMERFVKRDGGHFFDAGTVISVDETDGIHWNAAAHRDLGKAVARYVRDTI